MRNLIELLHLEPDPAAASRVERTLARLDGRLETGGRVMPFMVANLAAWHQGLTQIVVVGRRDGDDTRALQREIAARYLPNGLVLPLDPASTAGRDLIAALPWLAPLAMQGGRATAYVCRHFTCEQPVTTPDALATLLRE